MRRLRKLRLRFRSLFDRRRVEDDLQDELRDYLEREIERGIAAGASPEEARRLALAGLGGVERLKEDCRDARGIRPLEDTISDFRFALRTLRRAPGFTVTVVAALAFSIGVNTAIFSVVDTVLFRPLPFPNQDRLVAITEGVPSLGFPVIPFSCPDYLFVAAENRSFESTAAYRNQTYEVSGIGRPQRAAAARATASLFRVLGISPAVGREFTREEDETSKRVALLGYGFAESAFGKAESALGRTVLLDRTPYTVIGVMPRSFSFPITGSRFSSEAAELFVPVSWSSEDRQQQVSNFDYSMIARLRPRVTVPRAGAEVATLVKRIAESYPPEVKNSIRQHLPGFALVSETIPFREEFTGNVQRPLLLLMAAVAIVLLIGCADVANLMFSRMVGRRREFALRTALGAGTWRLARQTITEGLVLSLAGGAIGFFVAVQALPLLLRLAPDSLPRLNEVGLNWRMTLFVVIVTLATPLFFSLAPLFNTIRSAVSSQLRGDGRTNTQSKQQRLMMSLAVVVQFSLAFLLLTVAGLLLRSFVKAASTDPGFRPEHVITTRIALPTSVYKDPAQVRGFYDRLLTGLSALPGVRETGAVSNLPMGSTSNRFVTAEGNGTATERVDTIFCSGNALETLRVPLVRGRMLEPADGLGEQQVAVISEALAKRVFPHRDPLGRRIKFGGGDDSPWLTVVGVVGGIKDRLTSTSPRLIVFTTPEDWVSDMDVMVRTAGDPRALAGDVRREVSRVDPSLPASKTETLDRVLSDSLSPERFRTALLGSFAAAALLLAMLGIGGLLAYSTARRKQEFGVRIALGATRRDLLVLVFGDCLRLSGTGIAVGLAAAVIVTRELSAFLYDTSPLDAWTFVAVPSVLMLVATAAALVPAWRVVRTDPITALRME